MNTKRKIGIIIGTRPQFVKLFPLVMELNKKSTILSYFVIHTGQHFSINMSDEFISSLNLPKPDYNLNIHSLPEGELLGRTIDAISLILKKEKPQIVVVFGDSHSTLAGALATKYNNIPCAHVEAGLRSEDLSMPEEINRVTVDNISDILFTPTVNSTQNLSHLKSERSIIQSGDIMLDIFQFIKPSSLDQEIEDIILFTIHRRKLMNDKIILKKLVKTINEVNEKICQVIAPLHPNCLNKMNEYGIQPSFKVISPQSYPAMRSLITRAKLVITDSGGLQKEAYFSYRPCITIRENTEWTETLHDSCNLLVGYDTSLLLDVVKKNIDRKNCPSDLSQFGEGNAASIIVSGLINHIVK